MSITLPGRIRAVGLAALALLAVPFSANAQETYIALGDSYAFGYTNSAALPSNGNQGYAGILRGILDDRNGAETVELINLAISGETSNSFFAGTTTAANGVTDGLLRNPGLNTNYNATPGVFQSDKFAATIASLAGIGREVDYVTLQFGGNDILNLFIQPSFLALAPAQQSAEITARFQTLGFRLNQALVGIKTLAPTASISVVGYADVFAGLGAANPLPQSTFLTLQANSIISQVAALNNVGYTDIYTPFLGNETVYSQILTDDPAGSGIPNFHPTPQGYSVIASAIAAPEPGTATLLLLGALPVVGAVVRRRK